MTPPAAPSDFYAALAPVDRFSQLADPSRYGPVPDAATLFVADIVGSTAAIDAGRYKAVNVAAAAVIAAIRNALPGRDVPFSFGGDGASFVLAQDHEPIGQRALAATARWVASDLGMTLRAAAVPVADIRRSGVDLLLARFAVSPDLSYAMFAGGGLAWAEARMKEGAYAIEAAAEGSRVDLDGLTCRFARLPSRNGVVFSLILVPASRERAADFSRIAGEVLALAGQGGVDVRPVREGEAKLEWSLASFLLETKTGAAKAGRRSLASTAASLFRSGLANGVLRAGRRIGGFDPGRYLEEVVRNTDFRKFDDGLRMTLDCTVETANGIEALLEASCAAGHVEYGAHRQDAAMLTCFVPSPTAKNHVHFVDGASGGYALAAQALKARRLAAKTDAPNTATAAP